MMSANPLHLHCVITSHSLWASLCCVVVWVTGQVTSAVASVRREALVGLGGAACFVRLWSHWAYSVGLPVGTKHSAGHPTIIPVTLEFQGQ